jgi:rare lipoprotein A
MERDDFSRARLREMLSKLGTIVARSEKMRSVTRLLGIGLAASCIAGCAARTTPPKVSPVPARVLTVREGLASYYGADFQGKRTASGVKFDMNAMVAAHPSYPLGTVVRVTNLKNRRSVQLQILDRGPAAGPRADGVIIDVSRRAAQELGFIKDGRTRVRLEVLRWGSQDV